MLRKIVLVALITTCSFLYFRYKRHVREKGGE